MAIALYTQPLGTSHGDIFSPHKNRLKLKLTRIGALVCYSVEHDAHVLKVPCELAAYLNRWTQWESVGLTELVHGAGVPPTSFQIGIGTNIEVVVVVVVSILFSAIVKNSVNVGLMHSIIFPVPRLGRMGRNLFMGLPFHKTSLPFWSASLAYCNDAMRLSPSSG